MEQRVLGKTGRPVSIIGLGTWQLGADWGAVTEADALAVLRAAVDSDRPAARGHGADHIQRVPSQAS